MLHIPARRTSPRQADISSITFHNEPRELGEWFRSRSEIPHGGHGILTQLDGSTTTFHHSQQTRIRQFAAFGIFPGLLPDVRARSFDVKQIVGDLERQSEHSSERIELFHCMGVRSLGGMITHSQ